MPTPFDPLRRRIEPVEMTPPDPTQRQRDVLTALRQANRARREAETAAHQQYAQTTASADAAHKSTRQNAETSRKQALAAAQSQQQSAQRSAGSALETIRNRAQQQIDAVAIALRDGQTRVKATGLGRLWPAAPTKIAAVVSAQIEAELLRRVPLTEQTRRTLANTVNQWQEEQARAARMQRAFLYTAAAGLFVLVIGALVALSRYQEYQAEQRAQATATAQAEIAQATATAQYALMPPSLRAVAEQSGMTFVEVPAGDFPMGSPDGQGDANEHPQHTVYVDAYWIGRTEVTNAQYARCVEAGGCPAPQNSEWNDDAFADHPVTDVSWDDAVAYTRWLSELSGLEVRLPTEAEWEKACRGTLPSPGAGEGSGVRVYPWGNTEPNERLLNFNRNVDRTAPVGGYPDGASPYGALDMAGNVWEWTADWYDEGYYSRSPARNPTGSASGNSRVVRGGSWFNDTVFVRCALRLRLNPDSRDDRRGFRVVLLPPGF